MTFENFAGKYKTEQGKSKRRYNGHLMLAEVVRPKCDRCHSKSIQFLDLQHFTDTNEVKNLCSECYDTARTK